MSLLQDGFPFTTPINFFPTQKDCVYDAINKFNKHVCLLNDSVYGAGKTDTSILIAILLGIKHITVICPAKVVSKWEKSCRRFGIKSLVTSYTAFPSSYNNNSDFFHNKIDKFNSLVIFDECHHATKSKGNLKASKELITYIKDSVTIQPGLLDKGSRVLLLSHTPCVSMSDVNGIFALFGLYENERVVFYNIGKKDYEDAGFQEICEWVKDIKGLDMKEWVNEKYIIGDNHISAANARRALIEGYKDIFMDELSINISSEFDDEMFVGSNIFCEIEDNKKHKELIEGMISAIEFNAKKNKLEFKWKNATSLFELAKYNDELKLNSMIKLAKKALTERSDTKIVLSVNYLDHIAVLEESFKDIKFLVLTGKTPPGKIDGILKEFQTGKTRFLITTMAKIDEGIDLDDIEGKNPRIVYLMPKWNYVNLTQVAGRFYRINTTKKGTDLPACSFNIIYASSGSVDIEYSLYKTIAMKTYIHNIFTHKTYPTPDTFRNIDESGKEYVISYKEQVENIDFSDGDTEMKDE